MQVRLIEFVRIWIRPPSEETNGVDRSLQANVSQNVMIMNKKKTDNNQKTISYPHNGHAGEKKEKLRPGAEQDVEAGACRQPRWRQPSASPGASAESIPANTTRRRPDRAKGRDLGDPWSENEIPPRITRVFVVHRPDL